MTFKEIYAEEKEKSYFKELVSFVHQAYQTSVVYPKYEDIFRAFRYCELSDIRVVILGQDPYYNPNQAHGLCFSVTPGTPLPKSLINIFKELKDDLGIDRGNQGFLEGWAKQGVFLLNTILTVEKGKPLSHKNRGWETLTKRFIEALDQDNGPRVFVLWGREARSMKTMLQNPNHLILEAAHPSPLSCYNGFYGSRPFSKINAYLLEHKKTPIDWSL